VHFLPTRQPRLAAARMEIPQKFIDFCHGKVDKRNAPLMAVSVSVLGGYCERR
jgi:hypothetical protein